MEAGEAAAEAFAKREAAKLTDNWSNWPIALVPLSVVGLLQYVAPSLQLLIGVLVFKEAFDATRAVGFAAIWAGLVIFASDGLWRAQTPQAFRRAASSPCCQNRCSSPAASAKVADRVAKRAAPPWLSPSASLRAVASRLGLPVSEATPADALLVTDDLAAFLEAVLESPEAGEKE